MIQPLVKPRRINQTIETIHAGDWIKIELNDPKIEPGQFIEVQVASVQRRKYGTIQYLYFNDLSYYYEIVLNEEYKDKRDYLSLNMLQISTILVKNKTYWRVSFEDFEPKNEFESILDVSCYLEKIRSKRDAA